ncbi:YbaB/EbfC family nucleoid-associated protein [Mycolicibacterium fortuitum]|uniref:YbaB/EbfC family nucleoid-associated protein n=2 Tax=Mycolicibacterium fortuitum TaxID=1766 RepID=UPI0033B17C6B
MAAERITQRADRLRYLAQTAECALEASMHSAESPDGRVSVSVDSSGYLLRLRIAPGTTVQCSCEMLESSINQALRIARIAALRSLHHGQWAGPSRQTLEWQ